MSSSSRTRRERVAALAAVLLVAAGAGQWLGAPPAAAADIEVVSVTVPPGERDASLVAEVRNGRTLPPGAFSVTAAGAGLRTVATPLLAGQSAVGLVIDASAKGAPALQAGVNGAANFLLQAPAGARTAVIADTSSPEVVAPPRRGATDAVQAISGIRAYGERNTVAALTLAIRQLPDTPGRARLLVLYTSAPDAGGEDAGRLIDRLKRAGAVLAVVTTSSNPRYWSTVATGTGGLAAGATPTTMLAEFDRVAAALRSRYLVTFAKPDRLPATVSVVVRTPEGTARTDAAIAAAPGDPAPGGRPVERGSLLWVVVLGALALIVLAAAAPLLSRGRRGRQARIGPDEPPGHPNRPDPASAGDRGGGRSGHTSRPTGQVDPGGPAGHGDPGGPGRPEDAAQPRAAPAPRRPVRLPESTGDVAIDEDRRSPHVP